MSVTCVNVQNDLKVRCFITNKLIINFEIQRKLHNLQKTYTKINKLVNEQ